MTKTFTDKMALWPDVPPASSPEDDFRPWLEAYVLPTETPLGAVLVCPGGGYNHRAPHEAEPIARRFNASGYHAFVVHYRVAPHRHPAPLLDVARALRIIRQRAARWRVAPARVAVLGFSAGGHLAASLGVHFGMTGLQQGDALDALSPRPDALILCYPVISAGIYGHGGSFESLLGPAALPELRQWMSLEHQVTAETPPTFLWHTADDGSVPVENSLLFAQALRDHGVPFELHVYPHGSHGLGLAETSPHMATWAALAAEWLAALGFGYLP
ncbi:MAG TPA: alpha/beta hydrolase [Anaerolineae bacterium]|nr:alpha/beta hydrolase [Anaerolineae bacterium]